MQGRLQDAKATGRTVIDHYRFDAVNVTLIVPFGVQTGVSLGFDSRGTVTEETYDASGVLQDRRDVSVRPDVRRAPGDRRTLAQRRGPAAGHRHLTRTPDAGRGAVASGQTQKAP